MPLLEAPSPTATTRRRGNTGQAWGKGFSTSRAQDENASRRARGSQGLIGRASPLRRRIAEDRSDGSSDLRRQVRRSLVFPNLFPGFVPVARGVERSLLRARREAATLAAIVDRFGLRWEAHRDRVALVKRFALWIRYASSIICRYFPCFGEHDSYAPRRST